MTTKSRACCRRDALRAGGLRCRRKPSMHVPHAQPREGKVRSICRSRSPISASATATSSRSYSEGNVRVGRHLGRRDPLRHQDRRVQAVRHARTACSRTACSTSAGCDGKHRGRHLRRRLSLLDEKTGKWENFNIPDGLGDAFVYDVLKTKRRRVDRDLVGREPHPRRRAARPLQVGALHRRKHQGRPAERLGLRPGRGQERRNLARHRRRPRALRRRQVGQLEPRQGPGRALRNGEERRSRSRTTRPRSRAHHARQKEEMGLQGINVAYNPNYIVALEVDARRHRLGRHLGRRAGAFRRQDMAATTPSPTACPATTCSCCTSTAKGDLWIGTNNGLAAAQRREVREALTTAQGLFRTRCSRWQRRRRQPVGRQLRRRHAPEEPRALTRAFL